MPPIPEGARNLVHINPPQAVPRIQLGIVSPCSTCKNQRAEPEDGKPACPRRSLLVLSKARADDGLPLSPSFAPALLTGAEGTDREGTDALVNPVYSDEQGQILVWVAHLQDNMGTYGPDGKLINPPLALFKDGEQDKFDTDYIQCHNLPYVVRETEASYFQHGAYREWDGLEAVSLTSFQLDPNTPGTDTEFDPVKVAGFARKANFAFSFPRQKVDVDLHPRGT